jgi:hypothetical protein
MRLPVLVANSLKKQISPPQKITLREMGKSKKAGKTSTHTKEQTPLLPLSGNLQENLESSPCPDFSRATRRRCHRSVRGTSILQLVLSSPHSVCLVEGRRSVVGQVLFPHSVVMTRQFLPIPAVSATAERVFSFAGLTCTLESLFEGTLESIMWGQMGVSQYSFG